MNHRTIPTRTQRAQAWAGGSVLTVAAVALVVAVLSMILPSDADAQIDRMRDAEEATVGVQVSKAFIGDSELSWYTSTVRGRLLAPAGERVAFLADWGLSMAGTDFGSDWTLANPEVGIAFLDDDDQAVGYLSVLLPLARGFGDDDVSVFTGTVTDFTWLDRWSDNVWSVNGGYTPSLPLGDSETARFNLALTGSVIIPEEGGDTELFSRYVLGFSQDTETLRIRGDLEGLAVISESDLSFGDRTIHQIVLGVDGLDGGPGFFVRIPVDDNLDEVDAVVGATFTF